MDFDYADLLDYRFGMTNLKDAREAAGLTQAQLGERANTTQPQIRRLENGERKMTRDWAERLAPLLGVSAESLVFSTPSNPTPISSRSHYRSPPEFFGERDLPVYSAAEGGPGEMVVSTDPVEIVPRPWFMKEVKEGFAILIIGESMEPVYEPGDMAIVNPRLAPLRGKDAVFTTGQHGGPAGGEFKATIKRLLRTETKLWHVRQFNEPRDFSLDRREWPSALRVVGRLSGS